VIFFHRKGAKKRKAMAAKNKLLCGLCVKLCAFAVNHYPAERSEVAVSPANKMLRTSA